MPTTRGKARRAKKEICVKEWARKMQRLQKHKFTNVYRGNRSTLFRFMYEVHSYLEDFGDELFPYHLRTRLARCEFFLKVDRRHRTYFDVGVDVQNCIGASQLLKDCGCCLISPHKVGRCKCSGCR